MKSLHTSRPFLYIFPSTYNALPLSPSQAFGVSYLKGISQLSLLHTQDRATKRLNECFLAFRSDNQERFMVHHVPSTGVWASQETAKTPFLCLWRDMTE